MAGYGEKNSSYRHGRTGTSLYNRWSDLRQRCYNPNHRRYKDYGARGIFVEPKWLVFERFAAWADASGYEPHLQLDRIDNDGPYTPENCRWVTAAENGRNRRNNRRYEFFGESLVIQDAATKYGIPPQTITERIDKGMSPDEAVRPTSFCEPLKTKSDTTS